MTSITGPAAPTTTGKLHGLDHLRAFAISYVILFHYGAIFPHPEWTRTWGRFGWSGVDLFFVLSGFLIASQLFREIAASGRISLRTFFVKRFFRIMPAYWLVLALYFLLPAVRERETIAPLWKFLTFTQNIGLVLSRQGAFSHAWSLCIEEQFYLLLPFILIGLLSLHLLKRGRWLLAALFFAGLLVRYGLYQHFVLPDVEEGKHWINWYKWIYYPTWSRLDGILTGVAIAAMTHYLPHLTARITRAGNWLFVLGLAVLTGAYFLCADQSTLYATVWGFPVVSTGYGLVLLSAVSPGSFLYRTPSRITAALAGYSYGLYLIHKIIIHLTQEGFSVFGIDPKSNTMLLISMVFCMAGAWLLRLLVEKPFLQIRNRVLQPVRKAYI